MASYDVEEILDSRKKGKAMEYLVRWAPTWEAERNLNCAKLLKEFKEKNATSEENGNEENADENDVEEAVDDTNAANASIASSKRGRVAARNADKKRKIAQKKATPKKGRNTRRR